ncbi:calcium:proton antiporter [Rhizobium sp. L1K21]|uniref:calcium:proton antiporter n=1 Tax=Rhizobium sp. L1K21 TaxID=2954933 RepID=UPI0035939A8C
MTKILKNEIFMIIGALVAVGAIFGEHSLVGHGQTVALVATAVIVLAMILVSTRIAHHAEVLAARVGDPYGSMILTISAVAVEVVILAIIMQAGESEPTLVRDTIYSAVMIDINGMIGLAALLGGLRHGEQSYNDDSGRTYAVMILTAMGISMIVPEFIPEASRVTYSIFTIAAMLTLYSLFVRMQVGQHSYFFSYVYPRGQGADREAHEQELKGSVTGAVIGLAVGIILVGAMAEVMSPLLNTGLKGTGAPLGLIAVLVAAMSAAPEVLTALRAALANRMQVVVNIAMGASLSTVILTVPIMEALSLITDHHIQMAMTPTQTVMTGITIVVAAINFSDGETNAIEGMAHFVLFATFVMLTVMGL